MRRTTIHRYRQLTLTIVTVVLLAPSSLAFAQNSATPTARVPAREGNIYDHIDHQPTRAQVEGAEAAAGSGRQSSETDAEVLNEVKALLKETDRQDKKSDDDPNSHSSDER